MEGKRATFVGGVLQALERAVPGEEVIIEEGDGVARVRCFAKVVVFFLEAFFRCHCCWCCESMGLRIHLVGDVYKIGVFVLQVILLGWMGEMFKLGVPSCDSGIRHR